MHEKMTHIVIQPETYDLLQKHATGGFFKNPPFYRNGKYVIEVSNEVLWELQKRLIDRKLKTFDEVIRQAVLEFNN